MNLINHVLKEKSLCVFRIFMPEKLNNFKYALFQNIFAGVCVCMCVHAPVAFLR